MKKVLSTSLLIVPMFFSCAEEEPPPNKPSFVEGSLQMICDIDRGESYLSQLSFTAEDLDGAETLRTPSVEILSNSLLMEEEILPVTEDESECGAESCRMLYQWTFDATKHGRISCGDSGEELSAVITISDEHKHSVVEQITSRIE